MIFSTYSKGATTKSNVLHISEIIIIVRDTANSLPFDYNFAKSSAVYT